MNTSQEQLLCLLKVVIHGGRPNHEFFSDIKGIDLYDLALRQNVCALVYPTLKEYSYKINIDGQIMDKWKIASLFIITHQIRIIRELKTIFNLFKSNGILAISLKGLALKQVYPMSELRNMSDLDLFIQEKDMQNSIELLSSFGYKANSKNMDDPEHMHIDMHKLNSVPIELHRTLWHPKHMKNIDNRDWFKHIWENHRSINIEGIEIRALSYEDELINLVVHLARNLKNNNANLQQLCDIVFFLKKYGDSMDFNYINKIIMSMDLLTYFQYLLDTCNMFLELKNPIECYGLNRNKSINLMKDILDSNRSSQTEDDQWLVQMKIVLNNISFTRKLLKPLCSRDRFLRSIGLRFRY